MADLKNNFVFCGKDVVIRADGSAITDEDMQIFLTLWPDAESFVEVSNNISVVGLKKQEILPNGFTWTTIRSRFAAMGDGSFYMARAKALLEWRRNTCYCGRCGAKLIESSKFTAMECTECGNEIFPRINPCVIMLVSKGDEILLARHAQRNQDVYSCLAGFVEAGETLEQAVHREIMEETGIKVKNVKYYASQSWPFPAQLMFGFTAEYESGDITLQPEEIADAQWFPRSQCPATPIEGSLAYRLIHNS